MQIVEKKGAFDCSSSLFGGKDGAPPPVHKLRFPKYDGTDDPLGWLHKCEQFFRSQGTPTSQQVWTAAFYLEGAAGQWYYRLEKNHGEPSWTESVAGINKRFGPPTRTNPLGELMHLRCLGSIDEYQERFLTLLARCEDVNEQQQIAIFSAGLPPHMGIDVDLQKPTTLDDAMSLARAFERRLQLTEDTSRIASRGQRAPSRAALPTTPPAWSPVTLAATGSTSTTPGAPVKPPAGARFTRLTPEEMAQRRMDGLCFNCLEKFSREHAK
jgi:hypothetical protein